MYNLPIKYLQFIHVRTSVTDFLFVVCVRLQECIGGFRRSGYLHSPSALSPSCSGLLGWVSPHSSGVARESSRNGEVGKRGGGREGGCVNRGRYKESGTGIFSAGVVSDYIKPAILFISFLCAVSPILKTLTEAISTDTIWAMTVGGSNSLTLYS